MRKKLTPEQRDFYARRAVELAERRAKALTMRHAGQTYERIGEALGTSAQVAMKDCQRATIESVRIPAEKRLDRQVGILQDIVRANYQTAMDRKSEHQYQAQGKIIEALQHEAKLCGLYAPARVQVGVTAEQFAERAAELAKAFGTGPLLELARPALNGQAVDAEVVEEQPEEEEEGEPWSNL